MMNSKTLRLVLLISCCHALVHIYEHSIASVEQLIAADFGVSQDVTGLLGTCLGMPFGLFALAAGWAADRYGAKRLLLVYLFGCSGAALLACFSPNLAILGVAMFSMGTFASIYHPAGVALIAHHTDPENRPMALGYHGIFGSAGIAAGPFLAAMVLATGTQWQGYYLVLTIPGILLAVLLIRRLSHEQEDSFSSEPGAPTPTGKETAQWGCYFTLLVVTMLAGFIYKAVLTFLPRYLDQSGLAIGHVPPESLRNTLTGLVLLVGMPSQYMAGRIARHATLEPLMACGFFLTAPCLLWMGFAEGFTRVWAAAIFTLLFFLHQPLYNSLVAKYVPRRRRSLAYGLSFTIGFGMGSFGSTFAGYIQRQFPVHGSLINHGTLSVAACLVGTLAVILWRRNGTSPPEAGQRREPPENGQITV